MVDLNALADLGLLAYLLIFGLAALAEVALRRFGIFGKQAPEVVALDEDLAA